MLRGSPMIALTAKASTKINWAWVAGGVVLSGAVVTAANLTHDRLFHGGSPASAGADSRADLSKAAEQKSSHDLKTTVVLAEGKFRSAKIQSEPVRSVEMPREVAVTGRIEADPNRRVDVRPRASGVVRTRPVAPGSKVKKGTRWSSSIARTSARRGFWSASVSGPWRRFGSRPRGRRRLPPTPGP